MTLPFVHWAVRNSAPTTQEESQNNLITIYNIKNEDDDDNGDDDYINSEENHEDDDSVSDVKDKQNLLEELLDGPLQHAPHDNQERDLDQQQLHNYISFT